MRLEVGQNLVYIQYPSWEKRLFKITKVDRDTHGVCTYVHIHNIKSSYGYKPNYFVSVDCMLNRRMQ